jgi:hypothetical protein
LAPRKFTAIKNIFENTRKIKRKIDRNRYYALNSTPFWRHSLSIPGAACLSACLSSS